MNKLEKQQYIENLDTMSKDYSALFVASFSNMSVKDMINFRTEIRNNNGVAKVSKNNISVNNQNIPSPKTDISNSNINLSEKNKIGIEVKSPIIGTAYHAPEPGAKKFVEIGKKIKKGDTIMIVEAMKTMNHVPSTADGVVKEICVEDGQPVEFGQNLLILD